MASRRAVLISFALAVPVELAQLVLEDSTASGAPSCSVSNHGGTFNFSCPVSSGQPSSSAFRALEARVAELEATIAFMRTQLAFPSSPPPPARPLESVPSSLVGYMPFDRTVQELYNGISGTIAGGAAISTECGRRGGGGLSTYGGYVNYGQPAQLRFHNANELTIMMWAKGRAAGQATSYWDPISWHHSGTIGIVWQSRGTGDVPLGAGATGTDATFTGADLFNGDTWYHLTYVRSAAGSVTYVDGRQAGTGGAPAGPIKLCGVEAACPNVEGGTSWRVWIGADPHSRRFYGCIDEVKIFDRALSADEVARMGIGSGAAVLGASGRVVGWAAA